MVLLQMWVFVQENVRTGLVDCSNCLFLLLLCLAFLLFFTLQGGFNDVLRVLLVVSEILYATRVGFRQ